MQPKGRTAATVVPMRPRATATRVALDPRQAKTLHQQDAAHLVHGFVPLQLHQQQGVPIFVKGQGIYLWDTEGKRYIDALASLWNVHVGHGRKEIARAVAAQMNQLAFAPTLIGPTSVPTVQLATKLVKLAPKGLTRVIFTSGGSEANETLIRLVRAYWQAKGRPEKSKFVSLNQGYHGSSSGTASLGGLPLLNKQMHPGLPGILHIARPYCYRCELGKTYPSCQLDCAEELERVVQREGAHTIGAFIAEPIQGVGGVIVPPSTWLPKIREICSRHDILMACDEVITGFGRTGALFACTGAGVTPDILVTAKGITSGYLPLGAVLFKEEIFQTFLATGDDYAFWHGYTYTGHPTVCAAALANLEIIERERLVHKAREQGKYLQKTLATLRDLPIVGETRGQGLIAAVELVKDKATKEMFPADLQIARRVWEKALAYGVLTRVAGPNNIAICPPLIITRAQIDELVAVLRRAISDVAAEVTGEEWKRASGK
ncbi:MAG: aspartate aminotransferase family protein [Candidatus Binatia bacterium]|nr:aspartate aminotransferase family protein [Candidatus Binatia bacterium]